MEDKPASVALHVREVPSDRAAAALDQLREAALDVDGASVKDGSAVLELFTRGASKGDALVRLAAEVGSVMTVFVGDDLTDEDAFAALSAADVSIKVGASDSAARHRLRDTDAVAEWLRRLADKLGAPPAQPRRRLARADRRSAPTRRPGRRDEPRSEQRGLAGGRGAFDRLHGT